MSLGDDLEFNQPYTIDRRLGAYFFNNEILSSIALIDRKISHDP